MTYPQFNVDELVHHLEQSKMVTKEGANRVIDDIYSKVIGGIQHWLRDKSEQNGPGTFVQLKQEIEDNAKNDSPISTVNKLEGSDLHLDANDHESFLKEVAKLSPQQATAEAQPNQVTKRFITVHLQCPLCECPDKFTDDQLTQHMFDAHSMGPFRCLVKDCAQAFDDRAILRQHIKQYHQPIAQLHCNDCSKHFTKYRALSTHNYLYHQHGHFQCTFPACTFTGEFRMKMYDHYKQQHKPEFVCSQAGCNYSTYNEAVLKAHQRAHLGIKPYRCKWLNCHYSSSYQQATLSHIRNQHLAQSESANQTVAHSADPKDYFEVASDLL